MRLVLMGTGPFAVPSFEMLRVDGHSIAAVVTRPQVAATTKKGPPPSPVRLWAEGHQLQTESPESINSTESMEWLKSLDADLFVVCDYGQILSSDCLKTSKWGGINLHGSLLPRHRGAAPVQWSILSGDQQTGVSVIHMTPGLDAGPILAQDALPIQPHENAAELEKRLSQLGVGTVRRSISVLEQEYGQGQDKPKTPTGAMQDAALVTKAPRLKKEDGQIHVDCPVRIFDRQLRGLYPWPGCYGELELPNGSRLRIILHRGFPVVVDCEGLESGDVVIGDTLKSLLPTESKSASMGIVMADGVFCVEEIQTAGKKLMAASEFVKGYQKLGNMRILLSSSPPSLLSKMLKMESRK
jgi:methionyl-tRNA formyltransferase